MLVMKVLGKMCNFAIQTYLFGILFYIEEKLLENMLFMVVLAVFTESLYLNATLALWNYVVIPNQVILNIFMPSCLNVLDVTLKYLKVSSTMFVCINVEVMPFCKVYMDKMAVIHTNPLNPSPLLNTKLPEDSE